VQQMLQRVTGVYDEAIQRQGFDKIRSTVEVDLVDGRTLVQKADERYRGGPDNPFSRADLKAKFADCASLVLTEAQIEQAFTTIEKVDTVSNVRELVRALAPARS